MKEEKGHDRQVEYYLFWASQVNLSKVNYSFYSPLSIELVLILLEPWPQQYFI